MRLEQIVVLLEPVSILRALITRGPATIGCDDEQGDTFLDEQGDTFLDEQGDTFLDEQGDTFLDEQGDQAELASTSAVKSRAGT